jgi:hypothetical protein
LYHQAPWNTDAQFFSLFMSLSWSWVVKGMSPCFARESPGKTCTYQLPGPRRSPFLAGEDSLWHPFHMPYKGLKLSLKFTCSASNKLPQDQLVFLLFSGHLERAVLGIRGFTLKIPQVNPELMVPWPCGWKTGREGMSPQAGWRVGSGGEPGAGPGATSSPLAVIRYR